MSFAASLVASPLAFDTAGRSNMSEADLGYPNMSPLGVSYAMGQAGLHQDYSPDPNDPGAPPDEAALAFFDAASAGVAPDRSTWTAEQITQAIKEAKSDSDTRGLWQAFLNNGPIPTDAENPSPTNGLWGADDNITKERHIYSYQQQDNPVWFVLNANAALYCQIQGYSLSTNSWVLPRIAGTQVTRWRYDGAQGGPVRTGSSQWKGVVGATAWLHAHGDAIKTWALIIGSILITVVTFGVGAAVTVPLSTAILGTGLVVDAAAATALAVAIVGAIGGLCSALLKAAVTGDSSQLIGALIDAAVAVGGAAAKGIDFNKLAKDPTIGPVITEAKDVVDTMGKAANAIKALAPVGGVDAVENWIKAAGDQAKNVPFVNWDQVKKLTGPAGGVGDFFVTQMKNAANSAEMAAIHAASPWYAKGFATLGATMRAAEIVQQQGDPRALSQGRNTGLMSVRYMNSSEGKLASMQMQPILAHATPLKKAGAGGRDGASLGEMGRINVAPAMAKAAAVAVPAAIGGGLFLKYAATSMLSRAGGAVVERYLGWWIGGIVLIAGAYVVKSGSDAVQPLRLLPPTPAAPSNAGQRAQALSPMMMVTRQ